MDFKQYFIKNKIDNIDSFFKYARDCFNYGWMDQYNKFQKVLTMEKLIAYKLIKNL